MRIVKIAAFLMLLAFILPEPPESEADFASQSAGAVEPGQLLSAAADTVGDAHGFCARQPRVCGTAGDLMRTLEMKGKYAARLVYKWAHETDPAVQEPPGQDAGQEADGDLEGREPDRPTATVSGNGATEPGNTLRIDDLIPDWAGPETPESG